MSAQRPIDSPVSKGDEPRAAGLSGCGPRGPRIRSDLEELGQRIEAIAARMERPILQVGAFLESVQDLASAKPSSAGGSRLVVALQSYDMFHQEIEVVVNLIDLLTMGLGEFPREAPIMPVESLMANFEALGFHMDSARALIENTTSEIPHAISQVLLGAGTSTKRFQNWGFAKPLGEITILTLQLGATGNELEGLHRALAAELGVVPDVRNDVVEEFGEAGLENSSVLLF